MVEDVGVQKIIEYHVCRNGVLINASAKMQVICNAFNKGAAEQ